MSGNDSDDQKTTSSKDDRTSHRVDIQLLVDYRSNGNYLFDFCRDLGTGGVFIETSKPLSLGSVVDLTFTIPDSKETLDARGKVIWVQNEVPGKELAPGMGIQFDSFSPDQRTTLEKFIKRYNNGNGQSGSQSDRSA